MDPNQRFLARLERVQARKAEARTQQPTKVSAQDQIRSKMGVEKTAAPAKTAEAAQAKTPSPAPEPSRRAEVQRAADPMRTPVNTPYVQALAQGKSVAEARQARAEPTAQQARTTQAQRQPQQQRQPQVQRTAKEDPMMRLGARLQRANAARADKIEARMPKGPQQQRDGGRTM